MEMITRTLPESAEIAVLDLDGELDASNYLDVIERVREMYNAGVRQLVIDLSDLSFLSSSGLVSLHSAALIMRGENPPSPELGWSAFHAIATDIDQGFERFCVLVNPQGRVRKSLDMTGFSGFLRIFDDVAAAVQSFADAS